MSQLCHYINMCIELGYGKNNAVWPIFSDRIGGNLSAEEAIANAKPGYFPISDWWLTGEVLKFGCGDYYCSIPRTVVEETVPAWNIVRSRWQNLVQVGECVSQFVQTPGITVV